MYFDGVYILFEEQNEVDWILEVKLCDLTLLLKKVSKCSKFEKWNQFLCVWFLIYFNDTYM